MKKSIKHGNEFTRDERTDKFIIKFTWFLFGLLFGAALFYLLIIEKPL